MTAIIEELEPTPNIKPLSIPTKLLPFFRGTVPLPPSQNHATKPIAVQTKTGNYIGKTIATTALNQFKKDAAWMLSDIKQNFYDWSVINAIRESKAKIPLAVEVRIYFSTMWKSDSDNREKHAVDAVFNKLQLNDRLVVDTHMTKLVDASDPRVEIEVRCVVR